MSHRTLRKLAHSIHIELFSSLHKGVLVVPEYFDNILVAYRHVKGACTGGKFELNGLLVW